MTVQYTNRKSKTYYLHKGKTKTGKPKYYFSTKNEGKLVKKVPEGYEIYEHPTNAQVFLRRKQPKNITDIEKHLTDEYLKKIETSRRYIFDIKGKVITIFESDQDIDKLKELFGSIFIPGFIDDKSAIDFAANSEISYSPMMRFILDDKEKRTFITERYCFLGSIDDWMYIGGPDSLNNLLEEYTKHLGEDSFYDLY